MRDQTAVPEVDAAAIRTHEALVFVDGVRVRWRVDVGSSAPVPNWRCDQDGSARRVTCRHTAEAAAVIARQLLGLPVTVTTHEGEAPMSSELVVCTCMSPPTDPPTECPVHPTPTKESTP